MKCFKNKNISRIEYSQKIFCKNMCNDITTKTLYLYLQIFFFSSFPIPCQNIYKFQTKDKIRKTSTPLNPNIENQRSKILSSNFSTFHQYYRSIPTFRFVEHSLVASNISFSPYYEYSQGNYGIRGILVDWQSIFRSKGRAYLQPGYVNNGDVFRAICESPLHD